MKRPALLGNAAVLAALLLTLLLQANASPNATEPVLPWGDQGDGTYKNPILPADYSDPDLLRVGDDFYLVASEFHFMGIQVLHSRDLVNWRLLSRVFDRLPLDAKYDDLKAYSQGTWAPTLRYHDGLFYLYVCTPREGLLRWTAKDPAGPWKMTLIKAVDQWEDPCPFWDDDGQAWLIHGKLGAGPLFLHRMSADGSQLLDEGVEIYRGPVAEGPKLFKRNGWYYISLPEGGVERGGQSLLRSRQLQGPYERRVVVPDGGPHQGGLVELDNGEAWFIGFKSAGHLGRVPVLQPVTWGQDDWPVFGDHGRPVAEGKLPGTRFKGPLAHPQTSDDFDGAELQPQWQWNHNPTASAASLTERPGWLRLHGETAAELATARNTLTQKLWGQAGQCNIKLDTARLGEGQRAGLAFLSGKVFSAIGVLRTGDARRLYWGDTLGPVLTGTTLWLRGEYQGAEAHLHYSLDGNHFVDTGLQIDLKFSQWKGARLGLFCYGVAEGAADFDYFHFTAGNEPVSLALPDNTPIDREALVRRHNPVLRSVDYNAPLSVGNGGFAFTVDITGLQTFGPQYYQNGIPLETLARWCWTQDKNPQGYSLADAERTYVQADGKPLALPSRLDTPASSWLRRNPRLHPLGQISLEWDKPDGSPFTPADIEDPEQTLDLWTGLITSQYRLGAVPVTVRTRCAPDSDTVAIQLESDLVKAGKLRIRLSFPRGHDIQVKNTPALDWTQPETHQSQQLKPGLIERTVGDTHYLVSTNQELQPAGVHNYLVSGKADRILNLTTSFSAEPAKAPGSVAEIEAKSTAHWTGFWRSGAAVDFTGSTNPLATKLEERILLSRYLTAVQCVADFPPQESGLTCNTWYGKHHTEMLLWHLTHFIQWSEPDLAKRNLEWFLKNLPTARALAASRGLQGARWAKMIGPDGRESPGGNPLIIWNQPHSIFLCDLLLRQSPSAENLAKYSELVQATAECLVSMLKFDEKHDRYVLGPPLWIAQEIHDPATSQNPSYELAYWRWAIETAQRWRLRAGQAREPHWDAVLAKLSPLPVFEGKYTALESHPDTWSDLASRHDHPEMLMALGFFTPGTDVDRATMDRTLTGVLTQWDWATKTFGWDYPMVAMTATRLGRTADALEILLRDAPNNRYLPNGHCPVGADTERADQSVGRREIAVYLPSNGAFLSAVALMVAGWEGCTEEYPGFTKDGSWKIRAEGFQRLP